MKVEARKRKRDEKYPLFELSDTVRITRHDKLNITIEQLNEVTKKGSEETSLEWQTEGYYPDINTALLAVTRKGLISDEEDITSISDYYRQMELQINYMTEVVRKYAKDIDKKRD